MDIKKYMNVNLLIILIGFSFQLTAQIQPPEFEFSQGRINWAQINQDTNFVANTSFVDSKYALLRNSMKIVEDKIIESFSLGINQGSYVVCRNIDDGSINWQMSLIDSTRAEIVNNLIQKNDQELILTGSRLFGDSSSPNFSAAANAMIKTVNINSGTLISNVALDVSDGGVLLANPGNFSEILERTDSNFTVFAPWFQFDGSTVAWSILMDKETSLVDTLNNYVNPYNELHNHRVDDIVRLSNGNYAVSILNSMAETDTSTYISELYIIDENGAVLNYNDISAKSNYCRNVQLTEYNGHIFVRCTSFNDRSSSDFTRQTTFLKLNLNGAVEDFEPYFSVGQSIIPNICQRIQLEDSSELIVCNDNERSQIEFYKRDSINQIENISTLRFEDPAWIIYPEFLSKSNQNSYLLGLTMSKDTTVNTNQGEELIEAGGFDVLINFSNEDINLVTNTIELNPLSGVKIHPNPAISEIQISGLEGNFDFKILSMDGSTQISKNNQEESKLFDISHLSNGIYILQIKRSDKSIITKKIVKVD